MNIACIIFCLALLLPDLAFAQNLKNQAIAADSAKKDNTSIKKKDCSPITPEYFDSFLKKRQHLNDKLADYQKLFEEKSLNDFKKRVNSKELNTEHTYPFLLDNAKVVAHGLLPIDYFKDISCSSHERNQAWEILMSSIYAADKFPIKVFYHLDGKLRENLIQKVCKDGKTYYLGLGFYLD